MAQRVYGVKAVASELAARLRTSSERTDTEIAKAAVATLKWNTTVPDDRVSVTVKDGWITLSGTLDWQYQKEAAGRAVRDLAGVKAMTNDIRIVPRVRSAEVCNQIEAAFKRSAAIDARRINVATEDGTVVLSGSVHSWAERQEAERAAWAAPGVTHVDDRLTVVP